MNKIQFMNRVGTVVLNPRKDYTEIFNSFNHIKGLNYELQRTLTQLAYATMNLYWGCDLIYRFRNISRIFPLDNSFWFETCDRVLTEIEQNLKVLDKYPHWLNDSAWTNAVNDIEFVKEIRKYFESFSDGKGL